MRAKGLKAINSVVKVTEKIRVSITLASENLQQTRKKCNIKITACIIRHFYTVKTLTYGTNCAFLSRRALYRENLFDLHMKVS